MTFKRRTRKEKKLDEIGKYDQMESKKLKDDVRKRFERKPYSVNTNKEKR